MRTYQVWPSSLILPTKHKKKSFSLLLILLIRALNKKLRAEELLKLSKFPPSMAKREEEKKKNDVLDELEIAQVLPSSAAKQSVEFSPLVKKKKIRKKLKKSKSAIAGTRSQFAKSYIFDTKRDRDKGSVKVNSFNFEMGKKIIYLSITV